MVDIIPFGENAVLVNFEQRIDEQINGAVIQLGDAINTKQIQGVTALIPAYCSLTVCYDREKISFEDLKKAIHTIEIREYQSLIALSNPTKYLPVCYDEPYGMDVEELSSMLDLDENEIIDIHTKSVYSVFMLGFLPGFAYMGTLPDTLNAKRRAVPRTKVPMGAVGVAGLQTGIYPVDAPGGWQIIGQCPVPVLDYRKAYPFLFAAGDKVQFYAVDRKAFQQIETFYKDNLVSEEQLYESKYHPAL